MNEVLSFFKDVISGSGSSKPVGLTGFSHDSSEEVVIKKASKPKEVKISDLMKRPH